MPWPMAFGFHAQERAVADKRPAGLQARPPFLPREWRVTLNIDPVVADGILQHAARAAGGRRQAEAAVENAVVKILRVKSIAVRARILFAVARAAPCFVVHHAADLHVILAN